MTRRRFLEILDCLSERIQQFKESELRKASAYDAMLKAAKLGNIEFINAMRKANPDLLWAIDQNQRGIFAHAILNRRKAVFQLIHDPTVIGNGRMEIARSSKDAFGNSLLHLAAFEPFSSQRRNSPALQMQNEIFWFQEVEKVVHPMCKDAKNKDGKNPYEVFTENHKELVKDGEKWTKETASSYIAVGSIVVTLMFAALFTIPGGNNGQIGTPVVLDEFYFKTFILADGASIIASATSLLVFIGILTSRYAEIDFLKVLFLKLLLGILLLILSVCSMMVAFYAALNMILKENNIGSRWSVLRPILVLGSFPITIVLVSQLRFMYDIFHSTIKNPISSI